MVLTGRKYSVQYASLLNQSERWRARAGMAWCGCAGGGGGWAAVARMRRALLLLALGTSCAALMLYWRQQTDDLRRHDQLRLAKDISADPQWTWVCRKARCSRELAEPEAAAQSHQTCAMLCGELPLWPHPTGAVSLAASVQPLSPDAFSLQVVRAASHAVTQHLEDAFNLLRSELSSRQKSSQSTADFDPVIVRVSVNGSDDPRLRLNTDESYELHLERQDSSLIADITARSFCGARHGFETLSQLIWYDPYAVGGGGLVILQSASVVDAPRFPYRSLLLDTARNFFPVKDILRTLDAMAMNKLNTFHWHATDSQSFPLRLVSTARLADHGAYSPDEVYTVEDVEEIVAHARLRGIRVLIELDAPGHVGHAWSWGPEAGLGDLAYCVEASPWSMFCGEPPCGQLNPRNSNVYDLLEEIYREIIKITGVDDVFHLGGDEVSETCWYHHINDTQPMDLWVEFTRRSMERLVRANDGHRPALVLLWSSKLTTSPYLESLDPSIAVQVWGSSQWQDSLQILESGRPSVLSHVDAWYLDCGFGSWRDSSDGHCGPYRSWQQVYEHRPWAELDTDAKARVQGGAVCMWTEQLGPSELDARVWPRAAAFAERLWTDCACLAAGGAYQRLDGQRARLRARGVGAAPLWPAWCTYNPDMCLQNN